MLILTTGPRAHTVPTLRTVMSRDRRLVGGVHAFGKRAEVVVEEPGVDVGRATGFARGDTTFAELVRRALTTSCMVSGTAGW